MSLHPMVHARTAAGELTTIWCPKVEAIEAAEPLVRAAVAIARRQSRHDIRIDIWDDLTCVSVYRARVKEQRTAR